MTETVTMTREVTQQTGPGLMSRGSRTPCQYMAQLTSRVTEGGTDQATVGDSQDRPYQYRYPSPDKYQCRGVQDQ